MKPAQHGYRSDISARLAYGPGVVLDEIIGDLLPDALMRSGAVVVLDILLHNTMQLAAMENEHVIEAFTAQAANEAHTE